MVKNDTPLFRQFCTAWHNHDYCALKDILQHLVFEEGDYMVAKMTAENMTSLTPSPCHALVLARMPKPLKSDAFELAAKMWGAEDVYLWLEHVDPVDYIRGLSAAASAGITDSVELLISVTDCAQMDSEPLRWAAQENNTDCVRVLLPHSNPKDCDSEALQWACHHQNTKMADMLIPVSDCVVVRNQFTTQPKSGRKESTQSLEFLEGRISILQRNTLLNHLNVDAYTLANSMKRKI